MLVNQMRFMWRFLGACLAVALLVYFYLYGYKLVASRILAQTGFDAETWPVIIEVKTHGAVKNDGLRVPTTDQSCVLPKLAKDDPALVSFFHQPPPLKCDGESWVRAVGGKFVIDETAIKKHGKITCSYSNYFRVSDHRIRYNFKENMESGAKLEGDYFKSECKAEDGSRLTGVHSTVVPRPEVVSRVRSAVRRADLTGLNVYMFGFDSISHMTFQRKMPITYNYIKQMKGVVLNGYNIVGDGTPQAFIPILTGQTEEELPLTRKRYPDANYVDVYPMIWKEFKKAGYATMYGEDASAIGTFTYRLKGFNEQPTDHYYRTFYSLVEQERAVKEHCIGSEPQHVQYFRYGYEFMTNYPADVPKFGVLFHSLLSHDDINLIQVADNDTYSHLKQLEDSGVLNNTLLIVMSDHGHRFAKFRGTQQGQLEERLPFFSIVAPAWFRAKYADAWSNLQRNSAVLTTPFDIYSTLSALIRWRPVQAADTSQRSVSLWDSIPTSRTCANAHIEPHWCTCLQWKTLPNTEPTALTLAKSVTEVINRETFRERKLCAELRVESVESVRYQVPDESLLKYNKAKDLDGFVPDLSAKTAVSFALYQIRFRTTPGDALYEATVIHDSRNPNLNRPKVVVNLKDVSHINKFGDTPHCIIDKDYFLAKWCVCYDRI